MEDYQIQSQRALIQQPDPIVVPIAHSSSEPNEGKMIHPLKRVKEFKFEDEDDLLTKNFETGFDDDLEAILGADFIRMVTILSAKFEKEIGKEIPMRIILMFPG